MVARCLLVARLQITNQKLLWARMHPKINCKGSFASGRTWHVHACCSPEEHPLCERPSYLCTAAKLGHMGQCTSLALADTVASYSVNIRGLPAVVISSLFAKGLRVGVLPCLCMSAFSVAVSPSPLHPGNVHGCPPWCCHPDSLRIRSLLPALFANHIQLVEKLYRLKWTRLDGLGALVLTPTRELAMQIFEELRKVGREA